MALVAGRSSGTGLGRSRRTTVAEIDARRISRDASACGCIPQLQKQVNKKSKAKILKERIRQFSIWYFENEDQKEIEHVRRRLQRKKRRKTVSNIREIRYLRWLYFLDGAAWTVGLLFTLCSTVETIGENTPFYNEKEKYRVIGPLIIVLAMVILFLLSVFKRKFLKANEMNKPKTSFYVLPKKSKKSIKRSESCDTDDSGNVEDIEMDANAVIDANPVKGRFWENRRCNNHMKTITTVKREKKQPNISSEDISEFDETLLFHVMNRTDKRKTWAKTKWMRMNISAESKSSVDGEADTITPTETKNERMITEHSLETRPFLASFSTDSEFDAESVLNNGEFSASLKRDFSTKSKVSEVSNFSNFSESAPLIK